MSLIKDCFAKREEDIDIHFHRLLTHFRDTAFKLNQLRTDSIEKETLRKNIIQEINLNYLLLLEKMKIEFSLMCKRINENESNSTA